MNMKKSLISVALVIFVWSASSDAKNDVLSASELWDRFNQQIIDLQSSIGEVIPALSFEILNDIDATRQEAINVCLLIGNNGHDFEADARELYLLDQLIYTIDRFFGGRGIPMLIEYDEPEGTPSQSQEADGFTRLILLSNPDAVQQQTNSFRLHVNPVYGAQSQSVVLL